MHTSQFSTKHENNDWETNIITHFNNKSFKQKCYANSPFGKINIKSKWGAYEVEIYITPYNA
jgi:hypothetical protein